MRTTRLAGLIAAGALLLTIAGPVSAAGNGMVRVLHASPDAPNVDVYADGGKILSDVPFGALSDYLSVPAKTYAIRVCAAGSDGTVDANCPIITDLAVAAGKKYTVVASNFVATIKANVFVDGPATAGKASVRVVHLSSDTPAVDVLTEDGATTIVNALAYPNATAYLKLAAGSYDLKVCLDSDNTTCPDAVNPGPLDVSSGTAYTVWAIGSLAAANGAAPLTLKVSVDAVAAPATDTVETGSGVALVLLGAAAAFGLIASRRFATARAAR